MNIKTFALAAFLLVFAVLSSGISYAGSITTSSTVNTTTTITGFDVSIDRVIVNGQVVAESKNNLIDKPDTFQVTVEFTAIKPLNDGHVEVILMGRQSGDVVANATSTFSLVAGQDTTVLLNLVLTDGLKREDDFDLIVKVVDVKGNSEQKTYGLKTKQLKAKGSVLDVSIDRVIVNGQVVAESNTNFIDKTNDFDIAVEFTALEDLEDAHVEAILKDLKTGDVIADATPTFNLDQDSSASRSLRIELLDKLKQSNSFELTIKIVDSEGSVVQKVYGITMREKAGASAGSALDISIDSVEVEGDVVAENENNFITLDKDRKRMNLKVRLTSLENVQNAHIDAVLSFENGDVVADATTTFDISKGENLIKDLELPLIGKFEQNSFKLMVKVADADGDSKEKLYGLKISEQKFPFVISSIGLNPESNVPAGKALVATLSFKNSGVVPLEGINAKVSIPELGVSATKFVDQIKNSGKLSEIREDFILKILDNTPTGTYTVRSEIASQFGGNSEVKEIPVFILGKDEQTQQIVNDQLIINVPISKQDVFADREVIYPITFTNKGPDANTYTLLLDGASWANLRLSESNTFVLKPKESKTLNIYVSSRGNSEGEQLFTVTIKSNDEILKEIPLKGNAVPVKVSLAARLNNVLEVVLIASVILLAAIGLFFGIKKLVQGDSEDMSEPEELGEAYY